LAGYILPSPSITLVVVKSINHVTKSAIFLSVQKQHAFEYTTSRLPQSFQKKRALFSQIKKSSTTGLVFTEA
jgi:hypothetical protein